MEVTSYRLSCRIKSRSWPLGASRFRLFLVLRRFGLRREAIESRERSEREAEIQRQLRLHAEAEALQRIEAIDAAWIIQERELLKASEARKAARRIEEAAAYERMTEEQRTAWRREEEIVSWISDL